MQIELAAVGWLSARGDLDGNASNDGIRLVSIDRDQSQDRVVAGGKPSVQIDLKRRSVAQSDRACEHDVAFVVDGVRPGLTVDRIDPRVETERYVAKLLASRGGDLDEQAKALLIEDLASPCTEEVAVFHAFSHIVAEARSAFVVLDTAPTGHTLLLLDATGAYHRQMTSQLAPSSPGRIVTPLMRLQDPDHTKVVLVTLPETTPVSEAASLQEDLRRADIEPYCWVINKSLAVSGTRDPLLRLRLDKERTQIARVRSGLAKRAFVIGWRRRPPVGVAELLTLS